MKNYIFEGKKVSAYHYFRRTDKQGVLRKKTTKQISCSACGKKLWISKKVYEHSSKKRFCCDMECRNIAISKGENLNLEGGYVHKETGYHYVRVNKKIVLYHRALIERHIGRNLKSNEHVHHMNGIRNDNRLENLVIVSNKNHPTETLKYIQALQKRIRGLEQK